jgi:ribosome-associated toxin RatA of RatAB toxin-antitoxin module
MRQILLEPVFPTSKETLWQLFSEVENYPKYIKYCQKAWLAGEFREGSVWCDRSTVMFLPLKIVHKIVVLKPQEEIAFSIPLLGGGEIRQGFRLQEVEDGTKVEVKVNINFQNKLLDVLLGRLVESRNRGMMVSTIENFKKEINNDKNN